MKQMKDLDCVNGAGVDFDLVSLRAIYWGLKMFQVFFLNLVKIELASWSSAYILCLALHSLPLSSAWLEQSQKKSRKVFA